MTDKQRQIILKIAAASMVGLFLLDYVVITPAIASWSAQSDRIDALHQKVDRGQQTLDRQDAIRGKWSQMVRANLPADVSAAESEAFSAINRWAGVAGITFPSLTPTWQDHADDGYQTLEFRASIAGTQAGLSRFLYEMQSDPMPVNVEEYEIATHNDRGTELAMSLRFSFLRLNVPEGGEQ